MIKATNVEAEGNGMYVAIRGHSQVCKSAGHARFSSEIDEDVDQGLEARLNEVDTWMELIDGLAFSKCD